MENRIKEQQLCLFADRTSTATMRANQLRLYFSSFTYVLLNALDDAFLSVLADHTAGDPMDDKVKWTALKCHDITKALKKEDSG